MPSAAQWLVDKWAAEDFSESKALNFLMEKGWKELKNGFMVPPQDQVSQDELEAMMYLVDEWDFACTREIEAK